MNLLNVIARMFNGESMPSDRSARKYTTYVHATKAGPGRSYGVKKKQMPAGTKIERKAFEGNLGLRGRCLSGASMLAQQGKLGKK